MTMDNREIITAADARAFFHRAVREAADRRSPRVGGETLVYLGNLLASFLRADRLFDYTPDGLMIRPLAAHYQEALEARTPNERVLALRRLGDIALFVSGLFAASLERRLVDVDYYIAMGGNAYGSLTDAGVRGLTEGLRGVFHDLSRRFTDAMDLLAEVGDVARRDSDPDILRLYEIWLKSGSRRAADRLRQLGIEPVGAGSRTH